MLSRPDIPRLPPHLQEVCTILARGLVRLRRHTAEELARDAAHVADHRESSLHSPAHQSRHANQTNRRLA
jgi:hypothetical protein